MTVAFLKAVHHPTGRLLHIEEVLVGDGAHAGNVRLLDCRRRVEFSAQFDDLTFELHKLNVRLTARAHQKVTLGEEAGVLLQRHLTGGPVLEDAAAVVAPDAVFAAWSLQEFKSLEV